MLKTLIFQGFLKVLQFKIPDKDYEWTFRIDCIVNQTVKIISKILNYSFKTYSNRAEMKYEMLVLMQSSVLLDPLSSHMLVRFMPEYLWLILMSSLHKALSRCKTFTGFQQADENVFERVLSAGLFFFFKLCLLLLGFCISFLFFCVQHFYFRVLAVTSWNLRFEICISWLVHWAIKMP